MMFCLSNKSIGKGKLWIFCLKINAVMIREICFVLRILNYTAKHFFGPDHNSLSRKPASYAYKETIQAGGSINKSLNRNQHQEKWLPTSMYYCMKSIKVVLEVQFAYANDLRIIISDQVTVVVLIIYKYLWKNQPWEYLIGHIVPRVSTWTS